MIRYDSVKRATVGAMPLFDYAAGCGLRFFLLSTHWCVHVIARILIFAAKCSFFLMIDVRMLTTKSLAAASA